MLHDPGYMQSKIHCDGNRVAEVGRVKGVERFGETVRSDDIKSDGTEGKMNVSKLSGFFVSSQTMDKFVNLKKWVLESADKRSNEQTCFCSSSSNLRIARREKSGPRATRLLCAMWKSVKPNTERLEPKHL